MQHSSRAFPVIHIDGLSFNVRRRGGGTFGDLAAAYMSEISLPQNDTALLFYGKGHLPLG